MKVLLVNGSPHGKGNTAVALNEMVKIFEAEGIETQILHIGNNILPLTLVSLLICINEFRFVCASSFRRIWKEGR